MGKSWREVLPVHPATERFDRLPDLEFEQLIKDVKKRGVIVPCVRWSPPGGGFELLDGRHRLDAAEQAGLLVIDDDDRFYLRKPSGGQQQFPFRLVKEGQDPVEVVISLNLHRRHITAERRAELIEELLKAAPEKSDRQIAERAKTSPTTVGKVRKKLEQSGDVSTVDTRTDTQGRQQPAHKAGSKPGMIVDQRLPTPTQAIKQAQETGRPVVASDGYIYLGASKEEMKKQAERRNAVYGVREAVAALAKVQLTPKDFLAYALPHQLWKADERHKIHAAAEWLNGLRTHEAKAQAAPQPQPEPEATPKPPDPGDGLDDFNQLVAATLDAASTAMELVKAGGLTADHARCAQQAANACGKVAYELKCRIPEARPS